MGLPDRNRNFRVRQFDLRRRAKLHRFDHRPRYRRNWIRRHLLWRIDHRCVFRAFGKETDVYWIYWSDVRHCLSGWTTSRRCLHRQR